jgi:multicomponent Na+:H+ antiporter subunit C
MNVLLALLTGLLVAGGTWLVLQRRLLHLVLGISLLGHAANLLIFAAGGPSETPAFAPGGTPLPGASDPLPQALILTAIVIGFGATAFLLALAWRAFRTLGDDDLPGWRGSEPPLEDEPQDRKS